MAKNSENVMVKRLLRIPKKVDKAIVKRARDNNRSINGQIVEDLEMAVMPKTNATTSNSNPIKVEIF